MADVAKFWPFLLYFMGIIGAKKFQVFLKMDQNLFYVVNLNKTTKNTNKKTSEQFS